MIAPKAFVGLDLGGINLKVLGFGLDGAKLAEESAPTSDDGTRAWLDRARAAVRRVPCRAV